MSKSKRLDVLTRPSVTSERLDAVWDRIALRRSGLRRGHRLRWTALGGSFALAAAILGFFMYPAHWSNAGSKSQGLTVAGEASPVLPLRLSAGVVALSDGSHLELNSSADLAVGTQDATHAPFTVEHGGVWFDVKPGGPRIWTVAACDLQVTVHGTRFYVERDAGQCRVVVERGHVSVSAPRLPKTLELRAGQAMALPDMHVASIASVTSGAQPAAAPVLNSSTNTASDATPTTPEPATPELSSSSGAGMPSAVSIPRFVNSAPNAVRILAAPPMPTSPPAWELTAKAGEFAAAYGALGPNGVQVETSRHESLEELLLLADTARLSGHPLEALAPLEKIAAHYPQEPSTRLAEFTLGRLQLDAAGNAAAAYAAFDRCLEGGLPNALREDALARRAEAAAKLGDAPKLAAAREAYLTEYPTGRYSGVVRAWQVH